MSDEQTVEGRVLERISVARPYFALSDLELSGEGIVNASFPLHPTVAPEAGPVEAAQVARHLAILGSCAVAMTREDDDRHHYLATRAHYTRMANAPATTDGPLRAQAIGSWIDRRTARAMVTLSTVDGRALNLLDVEYTVLAPRMFTRLNPAIDPAAVEAAAAANRVGSDADRETVEQTTTGVRVDCGAVSAEMCAGHFPDYPAAPVAIVMGRLCRAAGLAMTGHLGLDGQRYRIEEGRVEATGLARAGQRLVLEAHYLEPVPGGHRLGGTALADDVAVGEVDVVLSAHGPAVEGSGLDDAFRDALVDPDILALDGERSQKEREGARV